MDYCDISVFCENKKLYKYTAVSSNGIQYVSSSEENNSCGVDMLNINDNTVNYEVDDIGDFSQ